MEAGPSIRLLNDPRRQFGRYELLKSLHAQKINDFDLWLANELPEDIRFPVFVRLARDHSGPKTDLIEDRPSLDRALAAMLLLGFRPEDMLVVEYLHTADAAGVFRKYSAYRIGNLVLHHSALIGPEWNVKTESAPPTPQAVAEHLEYVARDPDAGQLMPFFEQAAIEHGRIDYSFVGDRIQIWEINDNPQFVGPNPSQRSNAFRMSEYLDALDALGTGLEAGGRATLDTFGGDMWPALQRE
jgi:hypothetical protein